MLVSSPIVAAESVTHPFAGVTLIRRTETIPRPLVIHLAKVDLTAPRLSFELTGPSSGGTRETVRQTTLDFLNERHAQLAVNAHSFVPFPSAEPDSDLVGLAASGGKVCSTFETPAPSYAIVRHRGRRASAQPGPVQPHTDRVPGPTRVSGAMEYHLRFGADRHARQGQHPAVSGRR